MLRGCDTPWILAVVYASNIVVERRVLWSQLAAAVDVGTRVCLIGDFNVVKDGEEKSGGKQFKLSSGVKD